MPDVCTHGLSGDETDWLSTPWPRTLEHDLTSCCQDVDVQCQDGPRCDCCGGRIEKEDDDAEM